MYQQLMIFCFALTTSVAANLFLGTCTNVELTLSGHTLVADCKYKDVDDHEHVFKSALDLNHCLRINSTGGLAPELEYVYYHGTMVLRADWKQWVFLFQYEGMSP